MASAIAVDYWAFCFIERSDSIVEHCVYEFGIRRGPYRPGDRQAVETVYNRGKVNLSRRYVKGM